MRSSIDNSASSVQKDKNGDVSCKDQKIESVGEATASIVETTK